MYIPLLVLFCLFIPHTDIQKLFALHLVAKIAWQAHDAATSLKLVEKGLPKEDFAVAALIDFPIQITAGWLAGRWSIGNQPLRPWLYAWRFRVGIAIVGMLLVSTFQPPVTWSWMAFVIIFVVLAGFSGYVLDDIPRFISLMMYSCDQHYPVRRHLRFPHPNLRSDDWWDLHDRAYYVVSFSWDPAYILNPVVAEHRC